MRGQRPWSTSRGRSRPVPSPPRCWPAPARSRTRRCQTSPGPGHLQGWPPSGRGIEQCRSSTGRGAGQGCLARSNTLPQTPPLPGSLAAATSSRHCAAVLAAQRCLRGGSRAGSSRRGLPAGRPEWTAPSQGRPPARCPPSPGRRRSGTQGCPAGSLHGRCTPQTAASRRRGCWSGGAAPGRPSRAWAECLLVGHRGTAPTSA
mmetsp:Transcript_40221/g.113882  ORF Transcript_40221/g.113882 Transcript_40221/m.113882 type:complete len:203 (+) Transcript_40221:1529-2137(+)